jgi:hypothetical protein
LQGADPDSEINSWIAKDEAIMQEEFDLPQTQTE